MVFVVHSKEDKFIENIYESFTKELEEFFNMKLDYVKPKVFVIADRETVNQLVNTNTKDGFVAWTDKKTLFVLDRNFFVSSVTDVEYLKLIKHELCHCYFYLASNNCEKPKWLFEGLAIYLSGQNDEKTSPKLFKDFLNDYDMSETNGYKESGFAVEFLIKYYGKNKFLELIRNLKYIASKEKFKEIFKEVYEFELKYENFRV